jgi:hypothetical protein
MYSLENARKPLIPKDGQVGIFMLPGEAVASSTECPRILDWNCIPIRIGGSSSGGSRPEGGARHAAIATRRQRGEAKPETFTFLGFTHYCGMNGKGQFNVWRRTAGKRMAAKLAQLATALHQRMHAPGGPGRRVASAGRFRLLPIPRSAG